MPVRQAITTVLCLILLASRLPAADVLATPITGRPREDACHGAGSGAGLAHETSGGGRIVGADVQSWLGRAQGMSSLMFWTLGTGVGGGIVLNGQVWEGAHSHAAECGHMIIQHEGGPRSEHGIHGSVELYAGSKGLLRRCKEALAAGAKSSLRARIENNETVTPIVIAEEAKAGDGLADRLIMETAVYLAIGTVNIMHTLNPAMVLFGGAMTFDQHNSELGRRFIAKVRDEVKARAFPIPAQRTIIDYASLGGDAGFIGSAGCIRGYLKRLLD